MAKRRFRSRGRFRRIRRRGGRGVRRSKKFVKRVVRSMQETKYSVGTANVNNVDSNTGYAAEVTPVFVQGVTKETRLGNRIRYKYIHFRMRLIHEGVAAQSDVVRVILFWSRLPLTVPVNPNKPNTWADVFDQPGVSTLSTLKNTNLRVVMDRTRFLGIVGNAQETQAPSQWYIKKKFRTNQRVNFLNNLDQQPKDPKDKLYILVVTDRNALNETTFNVRWATRFSFYDL